MKLVKNNSYLLLLDEEVEIKGGDTVYRDTGIVFKITNENISYYKEVIPKTVHKIYRCISYYPLTKEAKELDLPLLPDYSHPFNIFNIKDSVEKLAAKWFLVNSYNEGDLIHSHRTPNCITTKNLFIEGYKAAQSKQYSLKDMKKAIDLTQQICDRNAHYVQRDRNVHVPMITIDEEEEIIQSLSTQQLPKEFLPEYEIGVYPKTGKQAKRLKTTINSEGKEELVGTYRY